MRDLATAHGNLWPKIWLTRTMIRQVLGAVAQFEKGVIVSKPKAARVRKRPA